MKKLNTVESHHGKKAGATKLGCLFTESSLFTKAETISPLAKLNVKKMDEEDSDGLDLVEDEFLEY